MVLTTFRGICEATLCIHSAKPHPLAHRDIKTANVLLKEDFTPVLMDLGQCCISFLFFRERVRSLLGMNTFSF